MYNASWMVIGQLLCTGAYPVPSSGFSEDTPAPGNVSVILTNQAGGSRSTAVQLYYSRAAVLHMHLSGGCQDKQRRKCAAAVEGLSLLIFLSCTALPAVLPA